MAKDRFSNLDLNLLKMFITLHQERNMRKAAERLFVSQPAVSKALQRLRDQLGDELFVKTHKGLRATEYANQLADKVAPILDNLSLALNSDHEFDPSQLQGVIKLAISPFLLSAISSRLFIAIRRQAPNVQIQFLNWSKSTVTDIINDEVIFGLNYELGHTPKELICSVIAEDEFCIYVRKDHPYREDTISLEDGNKYELATVIAFDWNSAEPFAEKILKEKGIEVTTGFRSELPSAVMDVVENTDMVFPASGYQVLGKNKSLRQLKVVEENVTATANVLSYFHHKNRNNPTTLWIKSLVEKILN